MPAKLLCILFMLLTDHELAAQKADSLVIVITTRYRQLKARLPQCDSQVRNLNSQIPDSGWVVGYFKSDSLQLLRTTTLAGKEKTNLEFYFDRNQLIYVLEQHVFQEQAPRMRLRKSPFHRKTPIQDSIVLVLKENRYCFHNNQLIEWLNPSHQLVDLEAGTNLQVGQGLQAHAAKLRALF